MISEIYYALRNHYDGSTKEALITLQELKDYLNDWKSNNIIEEYIRQVSIENKICPSCLNELNVRSVVVNTHEYMGKPVDEVQEILYCNQCNEEF